MTSKSKITAHVTFSTNVMIYNISFYFVQRHMYDGKSRQIGEKKLINFDIKTIIIWTNASYLGYQL